MIKKLHQMGIRSSHMYMASMASIGLSFASWVMSKQAEQAGIDRADRWGIFIGEWAPTFMAMGIALRMEETHRDLEEGEMGMFEESQTRRATTPAGI